MMDKHGECITINLMSPAVRAPNGKSLLLSRMIVSVSIVSPAAGERVVWRLSLTFCFDAAMVVCFSAVFRGRRKTFINCGRHGIFSQKEGITPPKMAVSPNILTPTSIKSERQLNLSRNLYV